jgi:formylmethanofuran dehydrogenase subunit E
MNAEEILSSNDFKKCLDFHGHLCPGLSIGYRAAHAALAWLRENRSADEELVAIVETDACSADAVQVLTGCTFGKGNFLYRDHGKQVLSLLSRKSGEGVRVALKQGAFQPSDRHLELIGKMRSEDATEEELNEFRAIHKKRSHDVLEMPLEDLFAVTAITSDIPEKAKIEPSKTCQHCGEPAMSSKLTVKDGLQICRDCLATLPQRGDSGTA